MVDHEFFSRPGPRLVDGVEVIAALLHPEAMPAALCARAAHCALQLVGTQTSWRFEPLVLSPAAAAASAAADATAADAEAALADAVDAANAAAAAAPPPAARPPPPPAVAAVPAPRSAASLVQTDDGQLILFGGEAGMEVARAERGLGDVWRLGAPHGGWAACSNPSPSPSPSPRPSPTPNTPT